MNSEIAAHVIHLYSCCRCHGPARLIRYAAPFCSDDCSERASDYTLEDGQRDIHDFEDDLNAMHLAEQSLSKVRPPKTEANPNPLSELEHYRMNLCIETFVCGGPITASASARAKAFIKTKNEKIAT